MFKKNKSNSIYTEKDIEDIYEANIAKIFKFFYYKTLSKQTSEDLTSDTFLVFIKIIKDETITSPQALLYGIAKKIFLKYLREKYKKNETSFIDFENLSAEDIEESVTDGQTSKTPEEKVSQYLDLLPQSQKVVLKLRLIDKLSLPEIAEKLGKNMNYVKTTQKRGLKSLKKIIECTPPGTNNVKGGKNV